MLNPLAYKIKNKVLTLRFSILSIFITLFVTAMLIVIGMTYFRYSNAISKVSFRLMKSAAKVVEHDISNEIQDISLESQFTADLIREGVLNVKNEKDVIHYTFDLMRTESATLPSVQSAFWGDESGSFIISDKTNDNTITTEIIDGIYSPSKHRIIQRNSQYQIVRIQEFNDFSYDPRQRPWYAEVKKTGQLYWSDVFPHRMTGHLGVIAAMPVYDHMKKLMGVFALNVRLDYLRNFIEHLKVSPHGVVFIATEQGKVVAFPGISQYKNPELMSIHSLAHPWIIASFDEYKTHHQSEFIYRYSGKRYFAVYEPIPYLSQYGWFVVVVSPENDFLGELFNTNLISILVALGILFIGVILMLKLVYLVVKPMNDLIQETEKIKYFKLQDTDRIRSRIKEIILLSDSIHAMKQGLRLFQKYVPAILVRQLVASNKAVMSGGVKKHLAILFSDIQDFTGISEKMDPHYLMKHLCEYFNEMSHVISQGRGTIDKYIGDSIMAFWGAPLPEESPCQQAARTALLLAKHVSELNKKWEKQGIIPFYTRIALHYGEVIVGNLGSDERLNYTAIGDAINLTSRLEGINKIYGSQILVSDIVYQMIQHKFVFRFLDCVTVKGKTKGITVYELLAESRSEILFDLEAYQIAFAAGYAAYLVQNWDEACLHFKKCLTIYHEDKLAPVYIQRCEEFKKNPPEAGWDGVWKVREK